MLARVCWSGGKNPYRCIGYQLVRNGLAWHYTKYSKDKRLARAQARAKKAKRGLWKQENPVPPWEWRKRKKSSK
jgi:endonuclease YncB( thermonuclease family)